MQTALQNRHPHRRQWLHLPWRLVALGNSEKIHDHPRQYMTRLSDLISEDHASQLVEAGSRFEFFVAFHDALRANGDAVRRYFWESRIVWEAD
jgi:GrpB-like predicted nucleotidyltransferase (UPF0157 family)